MRCAARKMRVKIDEEWGGGEEKGRGDNEEV